MKKGAFSGLLYRELVIMKKSLIIELVVPLCIIAFTFLVVLSFRFGNLILLSDEVKDMIFGSSAFIIKALPAFAVCFIVSAPVNAAGFEIKTIWTRFLRSTPVSGFRLALAKYTIITALTLLAAGGSIGVSALMCAAMGEAFTVTDAAVALVLLALVVIMSVIMQVAVIFFKSTDKGGLAAVGIILIFVAAYKNMIPELTNAELLNFFLEKMVSILPFVPFVIAAALALGLFATTMIYKRREK